MQVSSKVETISPEMARDWLRGNTLNRRINPGVVARYAEAMSRGRWDLNGESVKLSSTGQLIDGQHRLSAVMRSGVHVPMVVVRGLPASAQDTIDIGNRRTVGSSLALRGVRQSNIVAAMINKVRTYEARGTFRHMGGAYYPTPAEAIAAYEAEESLLEEGAQHAMRWNKYFRTETGVVGAMFVLIGRADLPAAREFFDSMTHGSSMDSKDSRLVLRNLLLADAVRAPFSRMSPVRRAALTVLGWNSWYEKRPVSRIQWNESKDSFPAIIR